MRNPWKLTSSVFVADTVGVDAPESWWAGVGRDAAVVMPAGGNSCGVVAVVSNSLRVREGGSVDVTLLMVARQLIVMCD